MSSAIRPGKQRAALLVRFDALDDAADGQLFGQADSRPGESHRGGVGGQSADERAVDLDAGDGQFGEIPK